MRTFLFFILFSVAASGAEKKSLHFQCALTLSSFKKLPCEEGESESDYGVSFCVRKHFTGVETHFKFDSPDLDDWEPDAAYSLLKQRQPRSEYVVHEQEKSNLVGNHLWLRRISLTQAYYEMSTESGARTRGFALDFTLGNWDQLLEGENFQLELLGPNRDEFDAYLRKIRRRMYSRKTVAKEMLSPTVKILQLPSVNYTSQNTFVVRGSLEAAELLETHATTTFTTPAVIKVKR